MDSLRLGGDWDLCLTVGGNLAMVTGRESVAQDVACYERTFYGEPWYASEDGVPYLDRELADLPPRELVIARANERALQVPDVATAETELTEFSKRVLHGEIRVTTTEGEHINVSL